MMTRNPLKAALLTAPFLMLVACGGGGGGGGDEAEATNPPPASGSAAAPLSDAAAGVPVVGELVADCTDSGVGLVDLVVDAVDGVSGDALPGSVPSLADVIDLADLSGLPILGGLVPSEGGALTPISLEMLLLMVGAPALDGLPVLGQLPTVCSSLLADLPADAVSDPAVLLEVLGDPTAALGVIPVLDESGDPVALILATLPSALEGGGLGGLPGLPSDTVIPDLTELAPLDPGSVPVLGDLVANLLGVLNGGSVGGLGGLTSLLGFLGFLLP